LVKAQVEWLQRNTRLKISQQYIGIHASEAVVRAMLSCFASANWNQTTALFIRLRKEIME